MSGEQKFYIDPVCKMKVTKPDKENLQLLATSYNGKIFYFCSPFCTAAFLDNPKRYISKGDINEDSSERNSV